MVADWLQNEQHFKVTRLTDDRQPVRAADIFKAVDNFVGLGTVQQLVVYFAGHGSVVGFGEFWLLSEAPRNPNEAVSFPETFELSRRCNIPNIVFISDACFLARIVGERPTTEEAKAYLEDEIEKVLPTIEEVCEGMSVSLVIKDVTWETLNNGEFVDWLKQKYKHARELKEPFDSYTAARGRTVAPVFISTRRSAM
jgi:hypothetical protein